MAAGLVNNSDVQVEHTMLLQLLLQEGWVGLDHQSVSVSLFLSVFVLDFVFAQRLF